MKSLVKKFEVERYDNAPPNFFLLIVHRTWNRTASEGLSKFKCLSFSSHLWLPFTQHCAPDVHPAT